MPATWPPRAVIRKSSGLRTLESALYRSGLGPVAGVDEVGRGACAGPLVVAACVLGPNRLESLAAELWDSGVTVHLVNPGVVATELWEVPGNDPGFADVEALPPEALVGPTLAAMRDGTLETWVPEWFADVAAMKAADLPGYLQGAAEYRAQQLGAG